MTKTGEQGNKPKKGARMGRSRTLLLPVRRTGSRVRFREKETDDEKVFQDPLPITPRSSELRWIREVKSERFRGVLSSSQRSPHSPLPPTVTPGRSSSTSLSGAALTSAVPLLKPSRRSSSLQVTNPNLGNKAEGQSNGKIRERRSRSMVVREPRRRRSSSMLTSLHIPYGSGKGVMLQESKSSSRDSDGSRGRPSSSHELVRSPSDRLRTRGSKREGMIVRSPVRSPSRSPLMDRSRMVNLELAMALPEEDTIEHMLRLKSDCSGSDAESMSMKGIVSSLIAIENEEL